MKGEKTKIIIVCHFGAAAARIIRIENRKKACWRESHRNVFLAGI
ncbi:MAG: hypothetical protein ACLTEE_12385 [Anaerobutyricum hallii]